MHLQEEIQSDELNLTIFTFLDQNILSGITFQPFHNDTSTLRGCHNSI